jgi:hypothetical protein
MKKYCLIIEGVNYFIEIDGKEVRVGFYATFHMDRKFETTEELFNQIIEIMNDRVKNGEITISSCSSSFLCVKEFNSIASDNQVSKEVLNGFSFYKMAWKDMILSEIIYFLKIFLYKLRLIPLMEVPFRYLNHRAVIQKRDS